MAAEKMVMMALVWGVWCLMHSLLISVWCTDLARRALGRWFALYRLFFVVFSLMTLLPIVVWLQISDQRTLFAWQGAWRVVQAVLLGYAVFMFVAGGRNYRLQYFLGIGQWYDFRAGRRAKGMPFSIRGISRYVRHPWYSGAIAFIWGMGPVTDLNLLVKATLTLYLVLGTILEERKLQAEIGAPYGEYQRRVPMLIPWKARGH